MSRPASRHGCERCQGKGGWMGKDGWQRCPCTRAGKSSLDALRRAQAQAGRAWRMPGT